MFCTFFSNMKNLFVYFLENYYIAFISHLQHLKYALLVYYL
jgi:hypothetical protein